MTLDEFWARPPAASANSAASSSRPTPPGLESDWLDWCPFTLRGPAFLVVDAAFAPSEDDGLRVPGLPGEYLLQVRVMTYGRDRRFSRLRAVRRGAVPTRGERLGETWTDTARTGVCDLQTFRVAWGDDDEASGEKLSAALETEADFGMAAFDANAGAVLPFVASGFGDGTYEVHALVEGGRAVGFEVEFIAPDEPYPFDTPADADGEKMVRHALLPHALFGSGGSDEEETPGGQEAGGAEPALQDESKKRPDFLKMFASALGQAVAGGKAGKEGLAAALQSMEAQVRQQVEAATADWREHIAQIRRHAPPLRIELLPASDDAWLRTKHDAADAVAALRRDGFEPAGTFAVKGQAAMRFAGFAHPRRCTHATLIDAGNRLFVGLVRHGTDGCIEEITNLPPGTTPLPDWIERAHLPGTGPVALLAALDASRHPGPWQSATAADFVSRSEEDYARHQAWLAERGGKTTAEVLAALKAANRLPDGDEGEELVRMTRNDEVEKSLWNWLRLQPNLPFAPDDVVTRLVIIYDDEPPGLLVNAWWSAGGDYRVKERELAVGPARAVFEQLARDRHPGLRKVLTKSTPLAADFWLPD